MGKLDMVRNSNAAYAPTQVLAEVFRSIGCLQDAKLNKCAICTVRGIDHTFSDEREAYAVAADGTVITPGDAPTDDPGMDRDAYE